jgi:hypothetical protein
LSSTSDYAPNTNQLLTNYAFITHSLALSLALKTSQIRLIHRHINAALARALGWLRSLRSANPTHAPDGLVSRPVRAASRRA